MGKRRERQTDLGGGVRRLKPRFGKLYTKAEPHMVGSHRMQSAAEARIAEALVKLGLSFDTHGALERSPLTTIATREELLLSVENAFTKLREEGVDDDGAGCRTLVMERARKILHGEGLPEMGRYDFRVEGVNPASGEFETHYLEYWGLYNPKAKINARSMRRNVTRNVIDYTFVKKPVKEALFYAGRKLISINPQDLRKTGMLEEKLSCLKGLIQTHTLKHYLTPCEKKL